MQTYVHGYTGAESDRLMDQATTLEQILHHDTGYPAGSMILEAGCGVGAQTVILAGNNPLSSIVTIDISAASLAQAGKAIERAGHAGVRFSQADIYDLPFAEESFDHIFVCFVLEHLPDPPGALHALKKVLRKGGSITVVEGDHGSFYCHPETVEATRAVRCLVDIQASGGGDSLIGRRLYPLLQQSGFAGTVVTPRMVYVDSSRPELVKGFTRNTFIAMVQGIEAQVLAEKLMPRESWRKGLADLARAAETDGTFCYTFFKATAEKL